MTDPKSIEDQVNQAGLHDEELDEVTGGGNDPAASTHICSIIVLDPIITDS